MATVRNLKTSITRMDYEDALTLICRSRDNRRVAKTSVKSKAKKSAKKKRVIDPFSMVKSMTDEQKARLRKELLGE